MAVIAATQAPLSSDRELTQERGNCVRRLPCTPPPPPLIPSHTRAHLFVAAMTFSGVIVVRYGHCLWQRSATDVHTSRLRHLGYNISPVLQHWGRKASLVTVDNHSWGRCSRRTTVPTDIERMRDTKRLDGASQCK